MTGHIFKNWNFYDYAKYILRERHLSQYHLIIDTRKIRIYNYFENIFQTNYKLKIQLSRNLELQPQS